MAYNVFFFAILSSFYDVLYRHFAFHFLVTMFYLYMSDSNE